MPTDDVHGFRSGLQEERENLEESTEMTDADRQAISQWIKRRDGELTISSLKTYIRRLRLAAERSEVPLTEMTESDYQDLIFDFRHSDEYGRGDGGMAESTVSTYEDALLLFLGEALDREWVDSVERTTLDNNTVNADEMLDPADIQALIEAASNARDVALIEFLADTGARIGLAASLRVKDVSLDDERATYTPNEKALGLKGADIKPYPLIDSRAAIRNYLRSAHPRPNDGEAALFHKVNPVSDEDDDGSLHVNSFRDQLMRVADRAGVDKPVNPHNFRHTAITRMYREGMSKEQIQHRVQWDIDTSMWERYVHVTAEEMNEGIFAEAGIIEAGEEATTMRKRCGQCNEPIPPHRDFCGTCGEPVDNEARELLEAVQTSLERDMVESDDAAEREEAFELKQAVDANAAELDKEALHQLLTSSDDD